MAETDQPIEEHIAQWRTYLRRRQAVHGLDVEELERHLRDQLAALMEAGLSCLPVYSSWAARVLS